MSTTTYTYTVNAPDCDDDHDTFDTFTEALAHFTDEGCDPMVAAEALTRAEEYGHTECRLGGRRYYVWAEERATVDRQIRQTGIVTEEFGSTITRVNHIDTYQCFELGETEHEGVEWDILSSYLAGEGVHEGGLGWDELPEEITRPWEENGYWAARSGEEFFTIRYDHEGWCRELAQASVEVVRDAVIGEGIVHAVEMTGETWSPREYNFSTDGYMARWTVDTDALEAWLADNGIVIENGRNVPGFIRTADDEVWYLGRALEEYLSAKIPDYVSDMHSYLCGNGIEDEYIEIEFTDAGRAWIEQYKAAH